MTEVTPAGRRRITLMSCAFERGMPLVGLALGAPLGRAIGNAAAYVAVGILIAVRRLRSAWVRQRPADRHVAQFGGLRSLVLGVSISLDELSIRFTLGLLGLPVVLVIALIGAQAIYPHPARHVPGTPPQRATTRTGRSAGWPRAQDPVRLIRPDLSA